ncbi:MAG: hypothetical protein GX639_22285 [Fibrobacter sp.]|nr:hypothetical protein [Fibrobacter sp.]
MYSRGLVLLVAGLFVITGCYTQFVTNQRIINDEVSVVIDSITGDTVKVINRIDTVLQKEREVCVWERDLMGYPRLRCYKSYYPRDWYVYNNTPWWYNNDPFWGDYDRCPRSYYYDPDCGCCKYGPPSRHYYRYNNHNRYDHHLRHNYSGTSRSSGNNTGSSSVTGKPIPQSSRTTGTKVPVSDIKQSQTAPVTRDQTLDKKSDGEPVRVAPEKDTAQNVKTRNLRSLRSR